MMNKTKTIKKKKRKKKKKKEKENKNEINEEIKLVNKINEHNETKATEDYLEKEENKLTENSEIIKNDQIKDNIGESEEKL